MSQFTTFSPLFMTTELQTERQGQTLVMRLNGPANRNALSPQVYAAGIELLDVAESNTEVRAIVITGHGDHFCAGADLQRLSHQRHQDVSGQGAHIDAFHQWIEALHSFPKPVIAAVEGVAAGAGMSLALACDLVVAADNAQFLSAFSQIGLSPEGGASWHLSRAMGRSRALAALWLGTSQTAQEWAAHGLVHRLCPAGQALSEALVLAEQLASVAPGVLASVKELVGSAAGPLRAQLDAEKQHFLVNLGQPEAGAAMDDVLHRRTAKS